MNPPPQLGKNLLAAGLMLFAAPAKASVGVPAIFSDHMVLQAGMPVPVWGWADPGEKVEVSFAGQTESAAADGSGKWMLKLDPLKGGDSGAMTIKGSNAITINDALVGEVWLCSGQSNMLLQVGACKDAQAELLAAKYPQVRVFMETSKPAVDPQGNCNGQWKLCDSRDIAQLPGLAYFFGRELHQKLNVPVGLVASAVGSSSIDAWTSLEAQGKEPALKPLLEMHNKTVSNYDPVAEQARLQKAYEAAVEKAKAEGKNPPRGPNQTVNPRETQKFPGNLFNAKIHPLIPYAIRGAIWYQGESNAETPALGELYKIQLPLLIHELRQRWGQGDFPFGIVQLPGMVPKSEDGWCAVREAQFNALSIPNTGLAVTLSLYNPGDPGDIHPINKQDVARRLSLWALAKVYGLPVPYSGPLFKGHEIKNGEVVCSFDYAGGLKAADGALKGFEIAGADQVRHPAEARIDGDKVVVSSPAVKEPVAVRYAWSGAPNESLLNGAGLPASPFRTDNWPLQPRNTKP